MTALGYWIPDSFASLSFRNDDVEFGKLGAGIDT